MAVTAPILREVDEGCRLEVTVQPRARHSALCGLHGDSLKVALNVPPVDGKANQALREFLADLFGCAVGSVEIERGDKSRKKTLLIHGVALSLLVDTLQQAGIVLPSGSVVTQRPS